ncbi:hypothetical protein ACWCQQ_29605 [Streptomyces sp. NPDC002143]
MAHQDLGVDLDAAAKGVPQQEPWGDAVQAADRHHQIRPHPEYAHQPTRGQPVPTRGHPVGKQHDEEQPGESAPQCGAPRGDAVGAPVGQEKEGEEYAGAAGGAPQAVGGTLRAEDTPGGGLTMVLAVRTAPERRSEQRTLPAAATP